MSPLQDFEVRSRGVAHVVERWIHDSDDVRAAWTVDDLLTAVQPLLDEAIRLHTVFAETGAFPNERVAYSHFVQLLETLVFVGSEAESLAAAQQAVGHPPTGLDRFRIALAAAREIVEEDRFATDAAFGPGGAMTDWD